MATISFYVNDQRRGSEVFKAESNGSDAMEFAKSIIPEFKECSSLILKYNSNENEVIWYRSQSLDEFFNVLNEKKCSFDKECISIYVSPPRKREPISRDFTQFERGKRINTGDTGSIKMVRKYHTTQSEQAKMIKFPILEPLPYPHLSNCTYNKELEKTLLVRIKTFSEHFKMASKQVQTLAQRIATRIEIHDTSKIESIDISMAVLLKSLALPITMVPQTEKLLRSVFHLASGLSTVVDSKWNLSIDSIQQLHGDTMQTDSTSFPGTFRISSIGGIGDWQAPHASNILELMDNLISFHSTSSLPIIFTGVMCHLHFETIHPFHDGNGRIGRMLLYHSLANIFGSPDAMSLIVLFISTEIMKDRDNYYKRLSKSRNGKVGKYVGWFLEIISKAISNSDTFINKLQCEIQKFLEPGPANQILSELQSNGAIPVSSVSTEESESITQLKADGFVSSIEGILVLSFIPALLQEFCTNLIST